MGHQSLRVQRGACAPVTIADLDLGPVPDPAGLCRLFADARNGNLSVAAGAFQRIAVSPDGSRVAFEVTDDYSILAPGLLSTAQKGLFLVRADGTDVRPLGPASRSPEFQVTPTGSFDFSNAIAFTPDGRRLVFTDLGAGPDGVDRVQIWMLRLANGARTQITHLPAPPSGSPLEVFIDFVDNRTIGFTTLGFYADQQLHLEVYTVSTDGTGLRLLPPVALPDGHVLPQFAIVGNKSAAGGLLLPGAAVNPMGGVVQPREIFISDGTNLLQLTNFHRVDTGNLPVVVSRSNRRVFFSASADPFRTNPTENCQLFSVDTFGGDLRQLTRAREGDHSVNGCFLGSPPGCYIRLLAQDRTTGSLLFDSPCDPLSKNLFGNQLFAIRPDGSGLRQITDARGRVTNTPEVVETDLPGPFTYQ